MELESQIRIGVSISPFIDDRHRIRARFVKSMLERQSPFGSVKLFALAPATGDDGVLDCTLVSIHHAHSHPNSSSICSCSLIFPIIF